MKIAVLSDTHVRYRGEWIPLELKKILQDIGFIVHCGDFEIPFAYEELNKLGKVIAVHGNMDSFELKKRLPDRVTFVIEGFKIGVIHGFGPPGGIEDRIASALPGVDVILYGHSHRPHNEMREGVLFFNPGSPTDNKFAPYNSYGIIELKPEGVKGEIIRI